MLTSQLLVCCFIYSWFYRIISSLSGKYQRVVSCTVFYSLHSAFVCILLNSYKHPRWWHIVQVFLSPFYRWGNQGLWQSKAFLKMTHLRTARARTGSNVSITTSPHQHKKQWRPSHKPHWAQAFFSKQTTGMTLLPWNMHPIFLWLSFSSYCLL